MLEETRGRQEKDETLSIVKESEDGREKFDSILAGKVEDVARMLTSHLRPAL